MTLPLGFLFFGTITYVEETIRAIIEGPSWHSNPVQFLVLDLALVAGVDMSAAEAFVRLQRALASKHVTLIFCGFALESPAGRALVTAGILGTEGVESFSTLNDAMECERLYRFPSAKNAHTPLGTENAYLRAWFRYQKAESVVMTYGMLH